MAGRRRRGKVVNMRKKRPINIDLVFLARWQFTYV